MSAVNDILDRLVAGELDLEQAAEAFAAVTWPAPDPARTLAEIEADPDPAPEPLDSFAAIGAAYIDGRLDRDQYARIVTAIAEHSPTALASTD